MAYIKLGQKKIKLTEQITMRDVIDADARGERLLTDIPGRVCKMIGAQTDDDLDLVFFDDRAQVLLLWMMQDYKISRVVLAELAEVSKGCVAGWLCNPWTTRYYPPTMMRLQQIADKIGDKASDIVRREIEMIRVSDEAMDIGDGMKALR